MDAPKDADRAQPVPDLPQIARIVARTMFLGLMNAGVITPADCDLCLAVLGLRYE